MSTREGRESIASLLSRLVEAARKDAATPSTPASPALDLPSQDCLAYGLKHLDESLIKYASATTLIREAYAQKKINHTEMVKLIMTLYSILGEEADMTLQHIHVAHNDECDNERADKVGTEILNFIDSTAKTI